MIKRAASLGSQPIRFLIAGAVNTGVSLVAYWLLLAVMPYAAAYTIGFLVGVLTSFSLNTYFVFGTAWSWRKLLAFPGVQAVNYLLGLLFLWLLVHVAGVDDAIAPLISIPLTIPFNFLLSRWLMLGRRPVTPTAPDAG